MSTLKQIPKLDKDAQPVLGDDLKPVVDEIDTGSIVGEYNADSGRARNFLAQFLVRSGRANKVLGPKGETELAAKVPTTEEDRLKGMGATKAVVKKVSRDAEATGRAEAVTGTILKGMEKATIENQERHNALTPDDDKVKPTHAVSAHGKGTDQVARLVHGRRADELAKDATPPDDSVDVTGTHGLPQTTTPKYATVGSDPKNLSGAFTSNQGMLHVVGEAFAQADLMEQHGETVRTGVARSKLETAIAAACADGAEPDDDGVWPVTDRGKLATGLAALYALPSAEPLAGLLVKADAAVLGQAHALAGYLNKNSAAIGLGGPIKLAEDEAEQTTAARAENRRETDLDTSRMEANVTGPGGEIGYNVAAVGVSGQVTGQPVLPGEIGARAARIVRTDGMENAKVILDPAFVYADVKDGEGQVIRTDKKRAGWNLQTAFANNDTPSETFANAEKIGASVLGTADRKTVAERNFKAAEEARVAAEKALATALRPVATLTRELDALRDLLLGGEIAKDATPESLDQEISIRSHAIGKIEEKIKELLEGEDEDYMASMFGGDPDPDDEPVEKDAKVAKVPTEEELLKVAELRKAIEPMEEEQARCRNWKVRLERGPELTVLEDELKRAAKELQAVKGGLETAVADAERDVAAAAETMKDAEVAHAAAEERAEENPPPENTLPQSPATTGIVGYYNSATGKYNAKERPAKPASMKGKYGEKGDEKDLTAHHLYPWNKIQADINEALADTSGAKLAKLLKFAGVPEPGFLRAQMLLLPAERSYEFAEFINLSGAAICWAPGNIFMGPGERGDDPNSGIDAAFTTSGLPTPASALAELMTHGPTTYDKKDFKKIAAKSPGGGLLGTNKLTDRLLDNMRDVHSTTAEPREPSDEPEPTGGMPRPYKAEEWTTDGKDKAIRVKKNEAENQKARDARGGREDDAEILATKAKEEYDRKAREQDDESVRLEREEAELRRAAAAAAQEASDRRSQEQDRFADRREKAVDGLKDLGGIDAREASRKRENEEEERRAK